MHPCFIYAFSKFFFNFFNFFIVFFYIYFCLCITVKCRKNQSNILRQHESFFQYFLVFSYIRSIAIISSFSFPNVKWIFALFLFYMSEAVCYFSLFLRQIFFSINEIFFFPLTIIFICLCNFLKNFQFSTFCLYASAPLWATETYKPASLFIFFNSWNYISCVFYLNNFFFVFYCIQ